MRSFYWGGRKNRPPDCQSTAFCLILATNCYCVCWKLRDAFTREDKPWKHKTAALNFSTAACLYWRGSKNIWSNISVCMCEMWTLPSLRGRKGKQRRPNLQGLNTCWLNSEAKHHSPLGQSLIQVFHLDHTVSSSRISPHACEDGLCKLSRLPFVLSCNYESCAVSALHWHVIIMASVTKHARLLGINGNMGHFKQITHRVCFVIESNKQDKADGKQWKELRPLRCCSESWCWSAAPVLEAFQLHNLVRSEVRMDEPNVEKQDGMQQTRRKL